MMNATDARTLKQLLSSTTEPIAIHFCDQPPSGIGRVRTPGPAGCSYWKLAADGDVFYTEVSDHLNCPIGAYTHGVELKSDGQAQLQGMIEKMVGIKYLKMEEVPKIPHRKEPLRFVVYAPLSRAEGTPDVVLFRGNARQIMLLTEAAQASGIMSDSPIMGRPACAVIAETIGTGKVVSSLGCIGNRVYTNLGDDEFYVAVPGRSLAGLGEALASIVEANSELEKFHRDRCACA